MNLLHRTTAGNDFHHSKNKAVSIQLASLSMVSHRPVPLYMRAVTLSAMQNRKLQQ